MMPTAWAFLDPRGMGITLSLSAALLALVLLITHRALGRRLPGMQPAAFGLLLASAGFALNMLQSWLLPVVGLVLAVVCMVSGVALVLGGTRQLRGLPVRPGPLAASCLASLAIALWFGVWMPDARWRIGLLSLLLAALALLLARTAWGEARPQLRAGMRLMALLGMVFAVLMGLRGVAAALGQIETTVTPTLVNAASVLAAGMSLIGGVVGLVLVLSGDLLALVEQQRTHDPLTGLLNRQGLRHWVASQSAEEPVVLGMVDLDHFKQINDLHGHGMGDQVIRHLARLLQACGSEHCRAARLGGEEFVVVALGSGRGPDLRQMLERLRQQFADTAPPARGHAQRRTGTGLGGRVRGHTARGRCGPLPCQAGRAQPRGSGVQRDLTEARRRTICCTMSVCMLR